MTKHLFRYLILSLLLVSVASFKPLNINNDSKLTVTIKGFSSDKGQVLICVFNSSSGFPDDYTKTFKNLYLKIDNNECAFELKNIPNGEYSISVVHDKNNNHKLDKNFIGMPTESVGVSNYSNLFKKPRFDKTKITIEDGKDKSLTINMLNLF